MNELARLIRKCHCGHPEGVHDLHAPFRCFACTCKVFSPGAEDELLTTLKRIADALEQIVGAPSSRTEPLQTPLKEGVESELEHEGDDFVDVVIGEVFLPVDVAPRVSKTRKKKPSQKNRAKSG